MDTNKYTLEGLHQISMRQIDDAAKLLKGLIIPIEQQALLDDIRKARISLMHVHHKLKCHQRNGDSNAAHRIKPPRKMYALRKLPPLGISNG